MARSDCICYAFDTAMLDEQEFRTRSETALAALNRWLARASDEFPLEADMNHGALSIEFEDPPGKFVVSPNAPVRQIWVSAQSKSFKLSWDPDREAFVLPATGESLDDLIAARVSDHLGREVKP